jgi:exopolyphosphatase/pppGpp-phosphohydrolase
MLRSVTALDHREPQELEFMQYAGLRHIMWHVLAGEEEGQLAFIGATASLASSSSCSCLVFDMGGRSTEFAHGEWRTAILQ